jgi:hypothetical protein
MTPTTQTQIETRKSGLDLDSRSDVTLIKVAPFNPAENMESFVSRLGNDAKLILEICNDGLKEYERNKLLADNSIPWYQLNEEDEIITDENKQPVVFSGTLLIGDKAKQFAATVLNLAKMMFGYPADKLAKGASKAEQDANRLAKQTAKDAATNFVLSNPAAVEALKK